MDIFKRRSRLLISICLLIAASAAVAHHGWSGYDSDKPLTLTGIIKDSGYEHPHGFIKLQIKDKLWRAVLAPPGRMESRGLAREALKPGNEATVMGYPHRTDANEMRAERITVAGKTVELR
ncbi:MAG TPA: DUF6152 family protein [Burkholderiales bacterium]|nr:DUF6152 family protein [Burkholderiales bacterium]